MIRILLVFNGFMVAVIAFTALLSAHAIPSLTGFVNGLGLLVAIAWLVAFLMQGQLSRYLRVDIATYRSIHAAIAVAAVVALGVFLWMLV